MWVIRNRAADPGWWGKDALSVCTAKNQFSCWFDKQGVAVRNLAATLGEVDDPKFQECLAAAREVLAGEIADPTGGADHYFADRSNASRSSRRRGRVRSRKALLRPPFQVQDAHIHFMNLGLAPVQAELSFELSH